MSVHSTPQEKPQYTGSDSEHRSAHTDLSRLLAWLLPVTLVCLAVAVFLPARHFGFTNWDDPANFQENTAYRGLSPRHFAWFFTTYHMGHYQPLNWLTFAVDFVAKGLDPRWFHLTQILLHGLAAACVFFLIRDLLQVLQPGGPPIANLFGAFLGTSLFAVNPLRVESVVWLSARTDLLATIFGCLSLMAYLRWAADGSRRRWWWASFIAYLGAVLSKEMAVTFPLVFVLLEVYPLRRLQIVQIARRGGRKWLNARAPFFLVALAGGVNAFWAAGQSVSSFEASPMAIRLAQVPYSLAFYIWKSLCPLWLSPLYELPGEFGWRHPWVITSTSIVVAIVLVVALLRRRRPGLLIASLSYFILILPVSGIAQRGPQLVADRYAYIAILPWVAVLSNSLARLIRRSPGFVVSVSVAAIAASTWQTRRQIDVWSNPIALWTHAIAVDRHNGTAHANLAQAYDALGRNDEAVREYETALLIRPTQPNAHRNLAALLNRMGRASDAIKHYLADIREHPRSAANRYYLGTIYERIGEAAHADEQYRSALQLDADFALAHLGLARLFLAHGHEEEAEPRLRRVLELVPDNTDALELLAQLCANTGRTAEAISLYDHVIAEAARLGKTQAAVELKKIRSDLATKATTRPGA